MFGDTPAPDMGGWLGVIQNFGITAVCLAFLAIAVWRIAIWVLNNVLKPLTDRHIKFLDDLSTAMQAQVAAMQAMATHQASIVKNCEDMIERQQEIIKYLLSQERMLLKQEEIAARQSEILKTISDRLIGRQTRGG